MITFLLSLTQLCDTVVLCAPPLLGQWLKEALGAHYCGDQTTPLLPRPDNIISKAVLHDNSVSELSIAAAGSATTITSHFVR